MHARISNERIAKKERDEEFERQEKIEMEKLMMLKHAEEHIKRENDMKKRKERLGLNHFEF